MHIPCIVTALDAEARPFIEHFNMQSQPSDGLRVYAGEQCFLLQTGIGKMAAAAKLATMLHLRPNITGIVNVGIAGSDAPVGTQLLAHCIEDAGSGKVWYPHLPPLRSTSLKTVKVQTHDKPRFNYTSDTAFDMEAAGICVAARGKLDSSAVQSIKIVSDNHENATSSIDKQKIHQWMALCIDSVASLLNEFNDPALFIRHQVDQFVESVQQHMHLTATQTHQLHRLTIQHMTMKDALPSIQNGDRTAKQLLTRLRSDVASTPLQY